jgi:hypothetical protein
MVFAQLLQWVVAMESVRELVIVAGAQFDVVGSKIHARGALQLDAIVHALKHKLAWQALKAARAPELCRRNHAQVGQIGAVVQTLDQNRGISRVG